MSSSSVSVGQILASHASAGVNASTPASQTITNLTRSVHANAAQKASPSLFAQALNSAQTSATPSAPSSLI